MRRLLTLCVFALLSCSSSDTPAATDSETFSLPPGSIVDLSYSYGDDTVYWPTADKFEKTVDAEGYTAGGYYYLSNTVRTSEHGGTHLDAPIHFSEGQLTTDEIPLENLMGSAVLIDVSEPAASDPDYLISVSDFENWEARHGRIPDAAIVLLRTGYGQYWPNAELYLGTAERGADAVPLLHFPGIDPDAASWLVENRSINAIGLDTASIDRGQSSTYETHQILFAANIPAFENVANLERLPETGFVVIALPMKIAGGSGGPLRIAAIIPESGG